MEHELLTQPLTSLVFCGVHVVLSLVFCVVFILDYYQFLKDMITRSLNSQLFGFLIRTSLKTLLMERETLIDLALLQDFIGVRIIQIVAQ